MRQLRTGLISPIRQHSGWCHELSSVARGFGNLHQGAASGGRDMLQCKTSMQTTAEEGGGAELCTVTTFDV